MDNSIRVRVTSCINSFIKEFQTYPYDYLYEEEIRAVLYTRLRAGLKETVQLPVIVHKDLIGMDSIRVSLVRAEYPGSPPTGKQNPPSSRFDVAIIHPDSKRRKKEADGMRNDLFWLQNLLGAIELKYWQLGMGSPGKARKKILSDFYTDIKKLRRYKNPEDYRFKFGLALLFIQEPLNDLPREIDPFLREIDPSLRVKRVDEINEVGKISCIEGYVITQKEKVQTSDVRHPTGGLK